MNIKDTSRRCEEITTMISDLSNILDEYCKSIVLYGSASHNSLVYTKNGNHIDFLSDIEFIVIPKDVANENNRDFRRFLISECTKYYEKQKSIGVAPFVDVNPVSLDFYTNAQHRISTFELKKNGVIVKGEDVLSLLPDIDADSYEPRIQNIEIVKGLKILLIESNKWFLHQENRDKMDRTAISYFLASSFLNILRTLLPQFGIFQSVLSKRVDSINLLMKNNTLRRYFSLDTLEHFEKVYQQKQSGAFLYPPEKLFLITLDGYKSLLAYLCEVEKNEIFQAINDQKEKLFWGNEDKINLLAKLTQFFVSSLTYIERALISRKVDYEEIEKVVLSYGKLVYSDSSNIVMSILDDYTHLEKVRWTIIGSKD